MIRPVFWARALASGLMIYLFAIGATFNGILSFPRSQWVTLALFGLLAGGWLLARLRRGWIWKRTPLDVPLVFWLAAFAIALLANEETWHRSVEGLWYVGLYVGVWYLLGDMLANGLRRQVLTDGLLIAGVVLVAFGYLQIWTAFASGAPGVPRPVGTFGNPNTLGAFLVVLIPLVVGRSAAVRGMAARAAWGLYAVLALVLLLFAFSRGAWLGTGAALAAFAMLALAHQGMLSVAALRAWWGQRSARIKLAVIQIVLVVLVVVGFVAVVIIQSFSMEGRSADRRTYLWEAALDQFAAAPLTGQGFFAFGRMLPLYDSIPPGQPHSHAHNIPLTVAAELGLPGLLAVGVTLVWLYRAASRRWQHLAGAARMRFIAATSAVVGFGVHHLFDTPAMMPAIALTGLLALLIAAGPGDEAPPARRHVARTVLLAGLWVGLLATGAWHSGLYSRYYDALVTALETEAFSEGAEELGEIIRADPRQPAYWHQQGYLYGLAAAEGDLQAAANAVESYRTYLELEPYDASAWANLAALHWQLGDPDAAQQAAQRAAELAPEWSIFTRQVNLYAGVTIGVPDVPVPESSWGPNWARFQYLRDVIVTQFLPQVGWGTPG